MEIAQIIFYLLAALVLCTSALAVSCRSLLHAALFFIFSLLGLAALFFLLGAPLLAALEVILYAGAIMMLMLFVIMMLPEKEPDKQLYRLSFWTVPVLLCLIGGAALALLLARWPLTATMLPTAQLSPRIFGQALFGQYWLAVELVSLLLFVALVGALYFGGKGAMTEVIRRTEGGDA